MSVCGSLSIDRPAKVQSLDDPAGRHVYFFFHYLAYLLVGNSSGAKRLDMNRNGFSHSDGVGHLDLTLRGKTGSDNILREMAGGVRGAAINLRGVFS